MTPPKLKMAQNQAKYLPLDPSLGYDSIMVPCAVHSKPAQTPRKAPANILKPPVWVE